jgi:hypothetical protein
MLIASSAGAAGEAEAAAVLVKVTIYTRDAAGKASATPNIKFHVTKLEDDFITKADGPQTFRLLPGDHTLTTVTGNICRFDFKVSAGKPVDIALIVPSSGGRCQAATPEALAGPGTAGSGPAAASAAH